MLRSEWDVLIIAFPWQKAENRPGGYEYLYMHMKASRPTFQTALLGRR